MGKMISMTAEKIRKNYGKDREKAIVKAKNAPETKTLPFKPGPVAARGFAAFKENINRSGRPKTDDPKVSISIRIPLSKAARLRETGPGWQTRISDFIVKAYDNGELTHFSQ
jgi:uncharacterized protein (DUF4415 family)